MPSRSRYLIPGLAAHKDLNCRRALISLASKVPGMKLEGAPNPSSAMITFAPSLTSLMRLSIRRVQLRETDHSKESMSSSDHRMLASSSTTLERSVRDGSMEKQERPSLSPLVSTHTQMEKVEPHMDMATQDLTSWPPTTRTML